MKLPANTLIAPEKLTNYLLLPKKRNDKSQWLAQAGYSIENWRVLENELKKLLISSEADFLEKNEFGEMYEINGELTGPNGKTLYVRSIWLTEIATGVTKFITMYPNKRGKK